MDVKGMLEDLKNEVELTDQEKIMVEAVMKDTADLTSRLIKGEDLSEEFALVKATALNLAEEKRAKVQMAVKKFLDDLVEKALVAAFAAL